MKWTKEQQKVIDLRNRNILVSAAAGSGKTAVLVERIITMLTKDENPMDVDELLIVTFTEAAAVEMKERILLAIEKKLEEEPDNLHLQKQGSLIHNAMITTIHSFCLHVIREHFHTIDLDPGFRIGEDGELKLLKKDVLDELLEHEYEEKEQAFLDFVERYATGRDDQKLEELILQIFNYSQSYPQPSLWLHESIARYEVQTIEEFEKSVAVKFAEETIRRYVDDGIALCRKGINICEEPSGPYMYKTTLEEDLSSLLYFAESKNLSEMFERKSIVQSGKLKANRDKSVDAELANAVKEIRKEVKDIFAEITKNFLFENPEQMVEDLKIGKETVQEIVRLVEKFADAFEQAKRSRNLIDFNDMEHLALRILTKETEEGVVPSETAREYQSRFREVMIDEYQDSNFIQEYILTSVSRMSQGVCNIFMVGDVKQSIYRFRLSRPELFMEKYNSYSLQDSDKQRIDLHKNFRSRKEILESTNFVFRQIMTEGLGGITYDENAALNFGADYYMEGTGNKTEVLLVESELETEVEEGLQETTRELEARAIANRIKELLAEQMVQDKETGKFRKTKYKDFVILTRSIKGWADVLTKVLNREGIPTYTGSSEGYFETLEVETVLNYLKVLDNPEQDIPLTSVLASPIGGFTGEELAELRSMDKKSSFSECVKRYLKNGPEGTVKEKLKTCFAQINYFRDCVPYTAIHDLLWKVLEETGYYYIASVMPAGMQRKANLDMLLEKAKDFERTSYKGLFNFVRYIEQLKKYNVDYGEAEIADAETDVVRIMSIHKSKGLEFPIVFVAGMNKKFNKQDMTKEVILDSDLGIGVDCIDLKMRTKITTFFKKVIQRHVLLENLGEELRILYVAMTRAKEKLILVGAMEDVGKVIEKYESLRDRSEEQLSFRMISGANTYFDWVLPCYLRYSENLRAGEVKTVQLEMLVQKELLESSKVQDIKESLLNWKEEQVFQEEFREKLEQQFSYCYPYEDVKEMKLKFTVSELKKQEQGIDEDGEFLYQKESLVPILPKKLQGEEKLTGAGRGTAYHKVLELLDFSESYDLKHLKEKLQEFLEKQKISKEMYESVRWKDLLDFLQTKCACRMQDAAKKGLLFKEQPFVLGIDASKIYKDTKAEEMLLVQGIIDVWFEEEGELVVLDYKTDWVQQPDELVERYHKQLDFYAEALERLTGKRVKEKIIYSFTLKKEIPVLYEKLK